MKKILQLITASLVLAILFSLFSCGDKTDNQDYMKNIVEFEMEKLTSEAELDSIVARGDDNIVDWQLSREFAEIWLENGIANGEYPIDSVLWEIPIAIYTSEGNIKFYEFRILSNNKTIGAIVGAATKDYGCPIVYEGLGKGYADEIAELYNSGRLLLDQLPRIVNNGYPSVVVGIVDETRGPTGEFDNYLDLGTGEKVAENNIKKLLDYYDVYANNPELVKNINFTKMDAAIKDYEAKGKAFWQMAIANKGHIADFTIRGGVKQKRTDLYDYMKKYWNYVGRRHGYYSRIVDYGACGATAEGFVLDYLVGNELIYDLDWKYIASDFDKKSILYKKLEIFPVFGDPNIGEATWPWNLGKAISAYGDYKVDLSFCAVPKDAIGNGLPGISLRMFNIHGGGFNHYRPIIAYKETGWGPFSWYEMHVLDLVDCFDSKEGSWETYHPINHFSMYNVLEK